MKRLEKILVNAVGTVLAVYAAIVLLFSLPFMQRALANWTANVLSDQLKSKVEIGSVNLGFLNRIIINDVTLYEPSGKQMASIARVSASINLFSLLREKVDIGTAQLFGVKATLYKETPESVSNYQFLVDAFTDQENEEPSTINLHLGSFIMRHADISYDVLSEETHQGSIDMNHLHLYEGGMNAVLRCLTNDSLNVSIRRLQAKELNAGLTVKDTKLKLVANKQGATLSGFSMSLPHSILSLDSLHVNYERWESDSTFQLRCSPIKGSVTPSDLAFLDTRLAKLVEPIGFNLSMEGDEKEVTIHALDVQKPNENLVLNTTGSILNPLNKQTREMHWNISRLHVANEEAIQWMQLLAPHQASESIWQAAGTVSYMGAIDYHADGTIASQGKITTGVGNATYDLTYDAEHFLIGTVQGDSVHLDKLQGSDQWGTTSFAIDLALDLANLQPFPAGTIEGKIHDICYRGYHYQNILFDAQSTSAQVAGSVSIDDENVKAQTDFTYRDTPTKDIQANLDLERLVPHRLHLTEEHIGEELNLQAAVNLRGNDFKHLYGDVVFNDIHLSTPSESYHVNGIRLTAQHQENGESMYEVNSDILSGTIQGKVSLQEIAGSFVNQLAYHLPVLFKPMTTENTSFTYDLTLTDAPILHHLTAADFHISKPLHIFGNLTSAEKLMTLQVDAPCLTYNGKQYDDIAIACNGTTNNMNVHAIASTLQPGDDDDEPDTSTKLDVMADVHNNTITSDLYLNTKGANTIILQLLPIVQFSDSLGSTKTDITLRKSSAVINDTAWTVSPSRISLYKKNIECHQVKFANNNTNSYLSIDGKASNLPSDSLVATLNNLEIQYFLSLVNFSVVRFAGKASGHAVVNNVLGSGVPDLRANLYVEDLSIQEGPLGDANITAHWNQEVEGISVSGRIIDLYHVPDGLTGRDKSITGITTVNGWISPAKNDMQLNVNTLNTNAKFLHGFLRGVFKEITGCVTGPISIIGPLNNVNIVGDAVPNMNLRLRATNVPYHIEGDTLHMRPYLFDFKDISIYDRFGHRSTINGQVTHRNMKNFAYHFKADLHELLAYDEKEFNSDKFLATVFADGNLSIDGSDGHPLYVNASVTPTRGSVFAYDAATPDAITGNSFIEFRDRDSVMTFNPHLFDRHPHEGEEAIETAPVVKDSLTIVKEAKRNYNSDIFINFDINLTPACEVKLRMDNIEDGYMRTFGNAQITAKWYNKGSFQMFGNYNINAGSYRLYLQDIIFRDLALQPGSLVEFNGNPFDANIHLICHHTINSVPLSDLTSTTAFSQNNKVKVICILDITGKLGNMDFKFDMDIPNVNEEVRQLVRSMINSEEEMNTQMIYLLGLGRFYPNEYARANGNGNSGQAMNSLLSSTLSGQINQMLSNMIGRESNWSFGSSLTTGEKGWDDLDVEGILEGRLLDERLLINGAFGYRDNTLTNQTNFIGDFEVKWRLSQKGNLYVKAYNQTNDRYFTKATLNTQGLGLSWRHDFENIRKRIKEKEKSQQRKKTKDTH